jgi:hypothetical protein
VRWSSFSRLKCPVGRLTVDHVTDLAKACSPPVCIQSGLTPQQPAILGKVLLRKQDAADRQQSRKPHVIVGLL